jgi:hypothetical protein
MLVFLKEDVHRHEENIRGGGKNVHVVFKYLSRARSLESLEEGQNWFLDQLVEIPQRSINVCFLAL